MFNMDIIIRKETVADYPEIKRIVKAAFEKEFGQDNETVLIEKLRRNPDFIPELSLVAVSGDRIVGYILFFPIKIKINDTLSDSLSLAPMAVDPSLQRKGIGKRLVEEGLSTARDLGHKSVIVLGHAEYYPRFGFRPASKWNIKPSFEGVPDNAFLAIELVDGALNDVRGIVQYPEEFN
jgi:predicted N-acetyltransferase YhbS